MSDIATYFHVFEVSYVSCEGNSRTANIILKSYDSEVSEGAAQSEYRANSDAWGDSPSVMTGAYLMTTLTSEEEMYEYCRHNNVFAEVYDY